MQDTAAKLAGRPEEDRVEDEIASIDHAAYSRPPTVGRNPSLLLERQREAMS